MSTLFTDDQINDAMLNGLKLALREELKTRIYKELENDIEEIINGIVKNLEFSSYQMVDAGVFDRKIVLNVNHKHEVVNVIKEK